MDGIIGGIILGAIGAFIKWSYSKLISVFTGKTSPSFSEIYAGKEEDNDYEAVTLSMSNLALGISFVMALVALILFLNL